MLKRQTNEPTNYCWHTNWLDAGRTATATATIRTPIILVSRIEGYKLIDFCCQFTTLTFSSSPKEPPEKMFGNCQKPSLFLFSTLVFNLQQHWQQRQAAEAKASAFSLQQFVCHIHTEKSSKHINHRKFLQNNVKPKVPSNSFPSQAHFPQNRPFCRPFCMPIAYVKRKQNNCT